jgi:hypothetical protein
MKLVPAKDYLNAGDLLVKKCEIDSSRLSTNQNQVFVSTEDPSVIDGALQWASDKPNWDVHYTGKKNMFLSRKDYLCMRMCNNGMQLFYSKQKCMWFVDIPRQNLPLLGLVEKFGGVNEMLNGLLNLQVSYFYMPYYTYFLSIFFFSIS